MNKQTLFILPKTQVRTLLRTYLFDCEIYFDVCMLLIIMIRI